jgi:hypothetical protein
VNTKRYKVLVYERGNFIISVGLGLQPSTGTSGRCSAEIDQQWFVFRSNLIQCLISVFYPVNSHFFTSNSVSQSDDTGIGSNYCAEAYLKGWLAVGYLGMGIPGPNICRR